MEKGSCKGYTAKYYYDTKEGICVRFWYSGCEGNENRFKTLYECNKTCVEPPGREKCFLPKIAGPCEGHNLYWYYDVKSKRCSVFKYGGCRGNGNRFETREQCEELCGTPDPTVDACMEPVDKGPCQGNYTMWFYNKDSDSCSTFNYGGCKGNNNRFLTELSCQQKCLKPGKCRGCGCQYSRYGCCPNQYTPAAGPGYEGCPCHTYQFGCCPDGVTRAIGPNFEGCSCVNTEFGCCPDGITPALGPNHVCPCVTSTHGCCPDGVTEAQGENFEGCKNNIPPASGVRAQPYKVFEKNSPCVDSTHGCCPNGVTKALGEHFEGCENAPLAPGVRAQPYKVFEKNSPCVDSTHGCCPDGVTKALGEHFEGCENAPLAPGERCTLQKDKGSCRAFTIKWFYDMKSGRCSRFRYGGCEGNENRFETVDECKQTCVKPPGREKCFLPKIAGPCEGHNTFWYYDVKSKRCDTFEYGGCRGNGNKFETREQCEELCGTPAPTIDACEEPVDKGPCQGNNIMWFYNKELGSCSLFNYGGCQGNNNRFLNLVDCQQKCVKPDKRREEYTIYNGSSAFPVRFNNDACFTIEHWRGSKDVVRFNYSSVEPCLVLCNNRLLRYYVNHNTSNENSSSFEYFCRCWTNMKYKMLKVVRSECQSGFYETDCSPYSSNPLCHDGDSTLQVGTDPTTPNISNEERKFKSFWETFPDS